MEPTALLHPPKESFIAWPPQGLSDFEVELVSDALERIIDGASRGILRSRIV